MTSADETREELAKVSSVAMTARRLLAGGKLVDLTALGERVRVVCEAVQAMPREDGQSLVEDMRSLINKLDQLTRELEGRLSACVEIPGKTPRGPYGGASSEG